MHSTSPSNAYVQTHMTYLGDGSPGYGEPQTVVEDYGTGKINRTTTTNTYDLAGRATDTTDAMGHEFRTTYNPDGSVLSVYEVDHSMNAPIATYAYNTGTGTSYGQPSSVTDGLSGVVDTFTYSSTAGYHYDNANQVWVGGGGDVGQVTAVVETWPNAAWWPKKPDGSSQTPEVDYSYTANGERNVVTYKTLQGTQRWQYADYCSVGQASGPSRAFQTLRQLDSSSNPTNEEMHYQFDGGGRLEASGFAQTPAAGFTPGTGQPWYDNTNLPKTRARVYYNNDARGSMLDLVYLWDTYGSGAYSSTAIQSYHCAYDSLTAQKTDSTVYTGSTGNGMNWTTGAHEQYGYDSQRDYLTSWTTSNDSLGNANQTWSYDAAGNRNDATMVDNLNRATTIGSFNYTVDLLGNRTAKGTTQLTWDPLNRLSTYNAVNTYSYRADGLRTRKYQNNTTTSTLYCYDGQMGFEDVSYTTANSGTTMTLSNYCDYALGARGVDRWTQSSNNGVYFPIYDPHGNQVVFIARSGASYWEAGAQRVNDPWGNLRGAGSSFNPYNRYCGDLGHKSDDETGLTYMRARYYDQATGRFISEDPDYQGLNWFAYCNNQPVDFGDPSGKFFKIDPSAFWIVVFSWLVDMIPASRYNDHFKSMCNKFLMAISASLVLTKLLTTSVSDAEFEALAGSTFEAALVGCLALFAILALLFVVMACALVGACAELVHMFKISFALEDAQADT